MSTTAGKGVYRQLFDYDTKSELSIRIDSFADLVIVPCFVLDGIWQKAFELTTDPNAIASTLSNDKGHMVKSSSGKRPYLVMSCKNNGSIAATVIVKTVSLLVFALIVLQLSRLTVN